VSIDIKTLIINFKCIESGIIPISGVNINHVLRTLEKMPDLERKLTTRKFRKILKKAIKKLARDSISSVDDYESILARLKHQCGLGENNSNILRSKKIACTQSHFRRWVVTKHLLESHLSNI
jgi:hypothetical protein